MMFNDLPKMNCRRLAWLGGLSRKGRCFVDGRNVRYGSYDTLAKHRIALKFAQTGLPQ